MITSVKETKTRSRWEINRDIKKGGSLTVKVSGDYRSNSLEGKEKRSKKSRKKRDSEMKFDKKWLQAEDVP